MIFFLYQVGEVFSQPFFVLRHPLLVIEQFGGTPRYNSLVNWYQVEKLDRPLELLRESQLRTIELESVEMVFFVSGLLQTVLSILQAYRDHFNPTILIICSNLSFTTNNTLFVLDRQKVIIMKTSFEESKMHSQATLKGQRILWKWETANDFNFSLFQIYVAMQRHKCRIQWKPLNVITG